MTLPEKLVALHRTLARHRLPHAFGGAIALAYWTQDPRGTNDIDVNVFVAAAEGERVLRALPEEIGRPPGAVETIGREGQMRLWWVDTPVDLFLDYEPIHAEAARNRRTVPFAGTRIPVLGPNELAIFKAVFDRTRDWADIEEMIRAGTLDIDAAQAALGRILDADDPRLARLAEASRRAASS